MKFELLVFDWDGTLMDSEARIVDCLELTFRDLALPPLGRDQLKDVIGLGLREAVDRLAPGLEEGRIQQFIECYRAHYLCGEKRPTALFPGALETLRRLNQNGHMLAVATGKSRRGLERSIKEAGCGELFVASRCADECFSKPHPQMLLELMDLLDTPPERTLMIGDTEYDMQMAQNAGARALGVSYGVHDPQRLSQHGALDCLDDIREMMAWLAQPRGLTELSEKRQSDALPQ